ncbi:MAG TPA: hypothetical protein VGI74_26025 [Streptosporangiaceae bacterium]|jgi:hypothetical protein
MTHSSDAGERPEQRGQAPGTGRDSSRQDRAYRVLGQLLERAAAANLPAIDWTVTACGSRVLGRCTAFPGPGQRRADFEAWRAELGTEANEAAASREVTRLAARAEREEGQVTVEVVADLYDDLTVGSAAQSG